MVGKQCKTMPDEVDTFYIMRGDKPIEHRFVRNQHGTLFLTNGIDRDAVVTNEVREWLNKVIQSGRMFHKE